jgi:uncharacterized membrane protein YdfJ with MMPL/SSD domain
MIDGYMKFLTAHHRKVLAFWFLWFFVAGLFGLQLLNNTKTQYAAPPGTPSAKADAVFAEAFPVMSRSSGLVVLVAAKDTNANLINTLTQPGGFVDGLTRFLNQSLVDTRDKYHGVWTGDFSGCTFMLSHRDVNISVVRAL